MVLNEFFSALGSGRFLLAIIICFVAGATVGGTVRSLGGKVGWSLATMIVVVGLLTTSEHVRTLIKAGESGVLPPGFFDNFVFLTVAVCVVLYFGPLLLAAYGTALQEAEERAEVDALGPDDLVRELNVVAAHPALAEGWFADNWKRLTDDARRSWVERNIDPLRELRFAGGENGFAGLGVHLPMYLAEIDLSGGQ